MKQLLQNMRDGKAVIAEVPPPQVRPGFALVRTARSLVSSGTERMVVDFASQSLLGKARSRPDLVRQVIDKARREGLITSLEAAFNRLDQPMALGYSSAGTILSVGEEMEGFQAGDRVVCGGGGFAVHAELAVIPRNLLARLPENVDFESGAFATLGAVALQGFRLAEPQLGENVCIIGLGLLGLMAGGIARAAGCRVLGIDLDPNRTTLAVKMGLQAALRPQAESAGLAFSEGRGFDVVLICADTASNDPVELAGLLARDRGKVVAIGAVGMQIPRKVYYDKELSFQVSRSYGPGRYDPAYEEKGRDYPFGYVRWTEGRNLGAFVNLLASGQLDVGPLISHHFPIDQAVQAYDLITSKSGQPFLGVLITYPDKSEFPSGSSIPNPAAPFVRSSAVTGLRLGVLGAGNYATAVFLPAVAAAGGAERVAIASASGLTASHAARKFGFARATSSELEILEDPGIDIVAILTRHQHHARQVLAGLRAGKHVFCEKPLALTPQELAEIESEIKSNPSGARLMVGFNRRFAPMAVQLANFFSGRLEPLAAHYRINAGYLPPTHWLHDPSQGGGRIIGEGCHFIDFLTFLTGSPPLTVDARSLPDNGRYHNDNVVIEMTYPDGSIGTVTYLANGDKTFPKERLEVFCGGGVAVLDDFRTLTILRNGRSKVERAWLRQDKGHRRGWEAFLETLRKGSPPPIPYDELFGVTRAAFAATRSMAVGERVRTDEI